MKNQRLILSALIISMMALSIVSAFGVSGDYWDVSPPNPLALAKGESTIAYITLQNNMGDQDVTAKVVIKAGSDIASIAQDTYFVKVQTKVKVPIRITLPKSAIVGDTKNVKIEVTTINPSNTGMVSMGTGYNWGFDVKVIEPTPTKKTMDYTLWLWILVLLIAIVIISIMIRTAKPKKKISKKR